MFLFKAIVINGDKNMLEKIFGPTVKYNKELGRGTVKFAKGIQADIRKVSSNVEDFTNCNIKKIHDEFILSSKDKDILKIDMFRPVFGGKPAYQGQIFMNPVAIPFAALKSLGKKLAKILNK